MNDVVPSETFDSLYPRTPLAAFDCCFIDKNQNFYQSAWDFVLNVTKYTW